MQFLTRLSQFLPEEGVTSGQGTRKPMIEVFSWPAPPTLGVALKTASQKRVLSCGLKRWAGFQLALPIGLRSQP